MTGPCKAVHIAGDVYWVGAIDWNVRDFHGYSTNRGTTYNAYLVLGERPALIDTVKAPFAEEMLERIASVIAPADIKAVISNHSEMDHSGGLPMAIGAIRPEKIYASVMGAQALRAHFHEDWKIEAVADGAVLPVGSSSMTFLESRMLHWPDSMIGFLEAEKILFSNDIFGMHLASSGRFIDEVPDWRYEAAKYYANIILPYSGVVTAFLKKFAASGLKPALIAPDHGPVWRGNTREIVELYGAFAAQKRADRAVVVYDTMWNSTEKLARAVAEGLLDGGTPVRVMPLKSHHRSDIAVELLDAGALLAGTPTLNKGIYPVMADFMTYIKGLEPQGLTGNVFGSYGWAPHGTAQLRGYFEDMGIEFAGEAAECRYVPDHAALMKAFELGRAVSARLKTAV
ncbi:MAG: FprA family A-type flavoprotein [Elusimicrobiaceae bacterium]|nr:FprA family A-type flavoprotein [Elusimicrobiaceae bacterium]